MTRRSSGDPSRLNHAASRRSSSRFGRNTPGIPPSRALSAGRLAALGAHAGSTTGCSPRRFAPLVVAFRSKYTRYSSLTRLVSRAPRRSRRSRHFNHRLLGAGGQSRAAQLLSKKRRSAGLQTGIAAAGRETPTATFVRCVDPTGEGEAPSVPAWVVLRHPRSPERNAREWRREFRPPVGDDAGLKTGAPAYPGSGHGSLISFRSPIPTVSWG